MTLHRRDRKGVFRFAFGGVRPADTSSERYGVTFSLASSGLGGAVKDVSGSRSSTGGPHVGSFSRAGGVAG